MSKFKPGLIIALIFTLSYSISYSETYYISNSGNDSNNGLSPVFSWGSISGLNSMMQKLLPGDIILFERGGYFPGQINLQKGSLLFGAYGNGKKPVISGAVQVNNWKAYTDKIFETDVDTIVKNLFAGGIQMTLARYPDSGYLRINKSLQDPYAGFYDSDLTQKNGYWDHTNVRVRTINWAYEESEVKSFNNKTVTFVKKTLHPMLPGWGYYFDNIFSELDYPGEWYFQKNENSNGKLFFYPEAGKDIVTNILEAGIYDYGFYSFENLSDVTISDLEIKNQIVSGIYFAGNKSGIKIRNCTFSGQMNCGINLFNVSENCEVLNCEFNNINGKGVYLVNAGNSVISGNIFYNTGMVPGYGMADDAFGMSAIILLESDSNIITKNFLYNTGHDGINCIGHSNRIEKNVISNSLLCLNDGAAIKSYGKNSSGTIMNNNFIFNVAGNTETIYGREYYISSSGTYLDAYCSGIKVIENTIVNCGLTAVYLYNECNNNIVKGNICFNNNNGIFFYKEENPMGGNIVTDNIFFGINENQFSVKLRSPTTGFIPGSFDKNYYYNPENYKMFTYESNGIRTDFDFETWKRSIKNNSDEDSRAVTGKEALYPKLFTNMSDDTAKTLLDPDNNFRDLNQSSVYGSILIPPYCSRVLLCDNDLKNKQEINIIGGPLDFNSIPDRSISSELWFAMTGENIKDPLIILSPDGFEISLKNGVNFSKEINIDPQSGSIRKIIYVRFIPEEKKNYYSYISVSPASEKILVRVTGSSSN